MTVKSPRLALAFLILTSLTLPAVAEEGAPKDEGQELYQKKCAMCHGANGVAKPTGKGSANLNDPEWQKATTDEAIAKVTLEGKNKMPKFEGKLTPEQVQAIIDHIRKL
jgi:mono/diheme cytochrome c family protein